MATIQIPIRLSGDIVVAEDAVARELHELTIGIEPVQDLHGYDHPWPAGGNVNLLPELVKGTYTEGGITVVVGDNNLITIEGTKNTNDEVVIEIPYSLLTIIPNNSYVHVRNTIVNQYVSIRWYDSTTGNLWLNSENRILQLTSGEKQLVNYGIRIGSNVTSGTTLSGTIQTSIEATSATTDWTPYSNICPISGHSEANIYREAEYDADADPEITIDLDGTIYGGSLNVLTGELTVDRAKVNLIDLDWTLNGATEHAWNSKISDRKPGRSLSSGDGVSLSNVYTMYGSQTLGNYASGFAYGTGTTIYVKDDRATTVLQAQALFRADGSYIIYELATPLTVQLTPSTLSMLQGTNTVWNDTGDTTLIYYRSIDMSLTQMYPAMPGSPKTSLAEGISAVATSMTLDDASVLPSAPNICVIGADSDAEVVSYSSIVGNVVSGLVRGLGGTTASAWASNTMVARNFTSLDHNTFILNITDLDTRKADLASPALTGTPTAPTPALSTDTDQLATTAFVQDHAPIHLSVTASAGSAITKSDTRITSTMRVINVVFGTPSNVTSNVTWTTSAGSVTFNATFTGSTTIDFDLVETN